MLYQLTALDIHFDIHLSSHDSSTDSLFAVNSKKKLANDRMSSFSITAEIENS